MSSKQVNEGQAKAVTNARAARMKCISFDHRLSSTAVRVAMIIYYGFFNHRTGTTEVGQSAIAGAMGKDTDKKDGGGVRTVRDAMSELAARGHVVLDRYKGGGGTNVVTFLPATDEDVARIRAAGKRAAAAATATKAAERLERNGRTARQSEKNFRPSEDQTGKEAPINDADGRKKISALSCRQSEEKFRAMYEEVGKNLPGPANNEVGKKIPPQSENFIRRSYSVLTKEADLWISLQ